MSASKYTKSCRCKLWFFRLLDITLLLSPLIIYFIIVLATDGITVPRKVATVGSFGIALLLTLFNLIWQKHLRCPLWICVIGIYLAIADYILPLIVILAVTSMLDELVLTPLIKHYKAKLVANKTFDERSK